MEIEVPKEETFVVPEGCHNATLVDVREVEDKSKKNSSVKLRLIFEVYPDGGDPNTRYLAGKNFERKLTKDSELRQRMEEWQGDDVLKEQRKFDCNTLKGKPARILICHIRNHEFERPFCNIAKILPPANPADN
jgi:hypothetical protein